MRYLELSEEAKANALKDYCDTMGVEDNKLVRDDVVKWFIKWNHNVYNEDGLLTHRNRNRDI
mgnify:CR=1 FL=1|tara:strand:- start:107 stop:292 length:186 start_codon:yes stop_codon:yes gene_type:complete